MKYSDYFIESLVELGYTHCFFVGGGNVMHLLESARTRMKDEEIISAFKEAGGSEPPDLEELDDVSKAFLRSVLPADAAPQLLPECPQQ